MSVAHRSNILEYFKKAFTLAEIMIVLVIIGVLSAILLPVAIHSAPDENVMKFKKGNNTLGTVIRELVNSDQYYANGDLGMKPDGTLIDGTHDGDNTYFCQTFADFTNVKNLNCSETTSTCSYRGALQLGTEYGSTLEKFKEDLDKYCAECSNEIGAEIILNDDIIYYQVDPANPFGVLWAIETDAGARENCIYIFGEEACNSTVRFFSSPNGPIYHSNDNGFDRIYKIFCMDVDGINKGEDPFGYGIRADGKILTGARADEWLKKSIQKGE